MPPLLLSIVYFSLSLCLSLCLSVYFCISVCFSVCLYVSLFISLSLPACLSLCLSLSLPLSLRYRQQMVLPWTQDVMEIKPEFLRIVSVAFRNGLPPCRRVSLSHAIFFLSLDLSACHPSFNPVCHPLIFPSPGCVLLVVNRVTIG